MNAKGRKYQLWEKNALSVDIWSEKVLVQKLDYIHQNPVRAGLCLYPEEYKFSSALFYNNGKKAERIDKHLRSNEDDGKEA